MPTSPINNQTIYERPAELLQSYGDQQKGETEWLNQK
jgi:hypothetical protein